MAVFGGAKVAKRSLIIGLMTVQGVNVIKSALLFMKMVFSIKKVYSI